MDIVLYCYIYSFVGDIPGMASADALIDLSRPHCIILSLTVHSRSPFCLDLSQQVRFTCTLKFAKKGTAFLFFVEILST